MNYVNFKNNFNEGSAQKDISWYNIYYHSRYRLSLGIALDKILPLNDFYLTFETIF